MIKVIAFDYTRVISAFGPIGKWMHENLESGDPRIQIFKEGAHKWDTGKMNLDEMYNVLSAITDVAPDKMWSTFFDKQILNDDVIELIKKLKNNYKIFIFSNHHGELLRILLSKHSLTDLFDGIVISSEHKMKKPDPEFFELLVEKTGVNKEEIIFIDDKIENVDGANEFGIKAFQFINTQQLAEDLKTQRVKI